MADIVNNKFKKNENIIIFEIIIQKYIEMPNFI